MNRSSNRLLISLLIAFLLASGLTAFFAFDTVRELFTSIGGDTPGPVGPITEGGAPAVVEQEDTGSIFLDPKAPIQPYGNPTPQPWDGNGRVTVLLMGLDYRDWELGQGSPRTDSLILLTFDPHTGTAGILSVPRDLWVAIPGFDYGKINTAYQLGSAYHLDGGGPVLAMATIEQFLGIDIDYYAQVDFNAYVRLIDEIGGVKVDVKEAIQVDPLGDDPPKILQPGVQTLSGAVSLAYARSRSTLGGDFDRAQRQQQVILAIRDRILTFDLLPILITKAPKLYGEIQDGIRTNLTLDEAIRLGLEAGQVNPNNIRMGVIGPDYVIFDYSANGQDILIPIPDKIRLLRDEIFVPSEEPNPVTADMSLIELVTSEGARLAVLNGTITPGLAAETTEYLSNQGLIIAKTDNADELQAETRLIDYTGNPYTLQFLVSIFEVDPSHIFHSFDPESQVDVAIILGQDWVDRGVIQ